MDRARVLVRVHQGDDGTVVALSQEDDLTPEPVLAPDVALGDGLDDTEVGSGEVDAQANLDGNASSDDLLRRRRFGDVEAF